MASALLRNLADAQHDNRQDIIGQIVDTIRDARNTAECWCADLDDDHNARLVDDPSRASAVQGAVCDPLGQPVRLCRGAVVARDARGVDRACRRSHACERARRAVRKDAGAVTVVFDPPAQQ